MIHDIPLMGVVLAGGKSSRMGTDKANLPHPHQPCIDSDITYLQYAVMRLRPLLSTIAISGRSGDRKIGSDVIAIADTSPHQGPVAGVAQSLQHAKTLGLDGILVTPVDMPNLTTQHLQRLIDAWQAEPTKPRSGSQQRGLTPFRIVAATFADQRPEPLLAIYPTTLGAAIESLAQSHDRSLSRWLKHQPTIIIPLPQSAAKNVNRPEDV
jgi:molybdopterin-guanine dinucleotide biosynthesis protein A